MILEYLPLRSFITNSYSGGTPKSTETKYYGGAIPWLTTTEINYSDVFQTTKYITELGFDNSSAKWVPVNSVIIAMYGRGTAGRCCVNKIPITTNQACYSLIFNPEKMNYRYAYYTIVNSFDKLDSLANGAVQQNLNSEIILDFKIPFYPLDEQNKIVSILERIDNKIQVIKRINDNLLEQGKSIFNRYQCNASIPSTVGNISKRIICGKTPSTKHPEYYGGKTPFITIPDMHNSPVIIKTERYLTEEGNNSQIKKLLPRFTVCVSCIATPGLVSLTLTPSHTNQQINSIICKDSISPFYLYYLLSSMSEHIIALGTGGSATLNLNKEEFSKMELLVIKPEDMKKIHLALNPLFLTLEHNMKEINDLIDLRDYLLPKLMSGEIDVSTLEIPN